MVNDQEPRYRLVDSNGNVVGSLFQNADGNVEIQDETGTGSVFGPNGIVTPAIDAGSVSTEVADSERYERNANLLLGYERIDRETPSSGEFNKDYSLTGDREYLLTYSARIERFEVRVRFDNDDGNNYIWYDAESIKQEDEDKILLWETTDNDFVRISGNVLINKGHFDDEGRWGIDHRLTGYSAERIADFGRDGTHTGLVGDTDMTLHFDGIQADGEAVIELWERDYS